MKKELKIKAISEKGSCCVLCGYNKINSALHFHHLNPLEKTINISDLTNWEDIQNELLKCILVCSNCHQEIHEGLVDLEILTDFL